jgi:hypothetical protein
VPAGAASPEKHVVEVSSLVRGELDPDAKLYPAASFGGCSSAFCIRGGDVRFGTAGGGVTGGGESHL